MKHPPRFSPAVLLLAALSLLLGACGKKPAPAEPEPQANVSLPGVTELNAEQAAASFTQNIQSKLDILSLAERASFALVKSASEEGPEEIVYVFRNTGNDNVLEPELQKISNKWQEIPPEDTWLPWEAVVGEENNRAGASMGTFRGDDFLMSLWIDMFATDLFVTYRKSEPEPIAPPAATP